MGQVKRRSKPVQGLNSFDYLDEVVVVRDDPTSRAKKESWGRSVGWSFLPRRGMKGLFLCYDTGGILGEEFCVVVIEVDDTGTVELFFQRNNIEKF